MKYIFTAFLATTRILWVRQHMEKLRQQSMDFCGNNWSPFEEIQNESRPIPITDNMGREIFWEDIGRPDGIISK